MLWKRINEVQDAETRNKLHSILASKRRRRRFENQLIVNCANSGVLRQIRAIKWIHFLLLLAVFAGLLGSVYFFPAEALGLRAMAALSLLAIFVLRFVAWGEQSRRKRQLRRVVESLLQDQNRLAEEIAKYNSSIGRTAR